MRIERLEPSWLNFLSGLATATAVNLVTAIVGSDGSLHGALRLLVVALPWLVTGILLWIASARLETASREVDRLRTPVLGPEEIREMEETAFNRVRRPAKAALGAAAVSFVVSIGLILWLFGGKGSSAQIPATEHRLQQTDSSMIVGPSRRPDPSALGMILRPTPEGAANDSQPHRAGGRADSEAVGH